MPDDSSPTPPSPLSGRASGRVRLRRLAPLSALLLLVIVVSACTRVLPTLLPSLFISPSPIATSVPTPTAAISIADPSPAGTVSPTPDATIPVVETPTPIQTPSPEASEEPEPTSTPEPVLTKSPTPTKAPTPTKGPSPTPRPTGTPAPTLPATLFSGPYPILFREDYSQDRSLVTNADGTATLDIGKARRGLVLATVSASFSADPTDRIKCIVTKNGGASPAGTYQYTLLRRGEPDGIPLQMGSGSYTITLYRRVDPATNNYTVLLTKTIDVSLDDPVLSPFLVSHQLSNFSRTSNCVAKANQLCAGLSSAVGKVDAVYRYIIANIAYDRQLADDINAGIVTVYVPDPDRTLSLKKGICFDYSALFSSMLRSQGIPVRLVMGIAPNGAYHAWNEVYFEGHGWVVVNGFQWVNINGSGWVLLDSTIGRSSTNQKIYDNIVAGKYIKQKYF